MTTHPFNLDNVDPSWQECIKKGLAKMDRDYLESLSHSKTWLPGPINIFNAFSLPIGKVNYVLFGESPYPRKESANGYAFWDAAVHELWNDTGLSKKVNRATSLRNFVKMLLVAEQLLIGNRVKQDDIANLDKRTLVQTNDELFLNLLDQGFLLLNTALVLQTTSKYKDARAWLPFISEFLDYLIQKRPDVKFILFGHIAKTLDKLLDAPHLKKIYAEHPYNHSFITNPNVLNFFSHLHLIVKK